jgi:hypothetical protein
MMGPEMVPETLERLIACEDFIKISRIQEL